MTQLGLAIALVMWVALGALIGAALAPVVGQLASWDLYALVFGVIGLLAGLHPAVRAKMGVPTTALTLAMVGYLLGFLLGRVWQVAALGILFGGVTGIFFGLRLQTRFTRNTRREPGAGFYRG